MNSSEAINALCSTSKRSQCDIVRQRHTAGLRATFNKQSICLWCRNTHRSKSKVTTCFIWCFNDHLNDLKLVFIFSYVNTTLRVLTSSAWFIKISLGS